MSDFFFFLTFRECFCKRAYVNEITSPDNLIVEMFHKSTHQTSKDRILNNFKQTGSTIRCVVATVALGME